MSAKDYRERREEEAFQEFVNFISKRADVYKYLHNTEQEIIARKILQEGFEFESHLDQTTDIVTGQDYIEIKYFFITRKRYGLYTIVIEIAKPLVDQISKHLLNTPYHFSEVITVAPPTISDNDEPLYRLPVEYIKGYYDHSKYLAVPNKQFDPYFYHEKFDENLKHLLQE